MALASGLYRLVLGMVASSQDWMIGTARAFALLAAGQIEDGAELLLDLESGRTDKTPAPLCAAVLNNAGLAHLLRGNPQAARLALNSANGLWQRILLELREAEIPILGRSSSFHLVLAARHHAIFAEARRQRTLRFGTAAAAITKLNRSRGWRDRGRKPSRFLMKVYRAFGPGSAEAAILRHEVATGADVTPYSLKSNSILSLAQSIPATGAEDLCADVERAAYMAGLIVPGLQVKVLDDEAGNPATADLPKAH